MADDDWGWNASPAPDTAPPSAPSPKATLGASAAPAQAEWGWNPKPTPAPTPVYSGSIVPMTRYSDGTVGFDSNAGVVGMAKNAMKGAWSGATLPGDVATGKVDPNSNEAIQRSLNMSMLASPDAAISTARKVLVPPSAEDLHAAAGVGYDAARDLGVEYSSPHVANMAATVQQGLNDQGILPELAPKTHAILSKLQAVPDGASSVPLGNLDAARRAFGMAGKDFANPTEQMASGISKDAIDHFVTNPAPEAVLSGPADQAASLITNARGNAAAGFRSDRINKGEDTAGLNAAAANSGQNVGNSIRQRAKAILLNPKLSAGYNQEELGALRDVVTGTPVSNSLRIVGNMLGGGGGMHSWITGATAGVAGAQELGPWGAAAAVVPPLVGNLAKKGDNYLTSQRLQAADELTRSRSPLYREQSANSPTITTADPRKGTLARSIPTDLPPAVAAPTASGSQPPAMTPEEARDYIKNHPQQQTFAKGGAVKARKTHEQLVQRLIEMSERAKAETKRETKPILNVPDDTVAKALAVAQRAI